VTSRSSHFVEVATDSELARGMTVVDRLNVATNERNRDVWAATLAAGHKAEVLWTIDNGRWKEALYSALR
jgi:inosine-uridine nucleoside N-ribohydrolase